MGSPEAIGRLDRIGEWWHRFVLIGGVLALVLLPRARRAWPLWATPVGLVMVVWLGNALNRYHHTTMALLAVFTGALLVAFEPDAWVNRPQWDGVDDAPDRGAAMVRHDPEDLADGAATAVAGQGAMVDEPVLTPSEALAAASRPAGIWAGLYGRPLHPVVAAVAIGAWVCALGFDLVSQVADTAWVYARGAYLLTAAGVVFGVLAATLGLADLVRIPRGTPAYQTGMRHLLVMDGCLVLFAVSFLIRRSSDFAWHDPVAVLPMGVSIVGLGLLAVGVWLGTRLAYTYGVRVAVNEDRLHGFETNADAENDD